MSDFVINVKLNGVEQSVSTVGELQKALLATKNELKNVEVGGKAFEQLTVQARNLQRELKDVKESTNFEQNIGQSIESISRLGSTITSAFALATSAISLFGGDAKSLSEEQVKAQQALTIALTATTIASNALRIAEDAGNAGKLVQKGLTVLLTTLTSAQTVALEGQTVATGEVTVAQAALNAVMAINPIFLLVAAVGALVGAYYLLSDSTDEQIKKQKELDEARSKSATEYKATADQVISIAEGQMAVEKVSGASREQIYENDVNLIKKKLEFLANENKIRGFVRQEDANQYTELTNKLLLTEAEYNAKTKELTSKASEEKKKKNEETWNKIIDIVKQSVDKMNGVELSAIQKLEDLKIGTSIEKADERLKIERDRTNKSLELENKATVDRLKLLGASNTQLKLVNKEYLEALGANNDLYTAKIEENNRLQVVYNEIKNQELTFGDFNYLDNKDKIATATEAKIAKMREDYFQRGIILNDQGIITEVAGVSNRLGSWVDYYTELNRLREETIRKSYADTVAGIDLETIEKVNKNKEELAKIENQDAASQKRLKDQQAVIIAEGTRQKEELKKEENAKLAELDKQRVEDVKKGNQQEIADKIAAFNEIYNQVKGYVDKAMGLFSALNESNKINTDNDILNNKAASDTKSNDLVEAYNTDVANLDAKYQSGLITQQEYSAASKALDSNLSTSQKKLTTDQAAYERSVRLKSFEEEKKLKIAQSIIAGISGAISAFTGAMSLGPIAGPIVGGILAGLVTATTAIQVNNIKKTQLGGSATLEAPTVSAGGASATSTDMTTTASAGGGFTGFNPLLTNTNANTYTESGGTGGKSPQRVYVLESDITGAQRRVSVAESNSSF